MSVRVETPPVEGRRRMWMVLAAAVAILAIATAVFVATNDGDNLTLRADGGDALASCLPFDVATLAGMSPAFAGTVVGLTEGLATLEVDRWYAGGEAEIVEIEYTPGFEALIGTPTLEVGQRYLITATDGVINGCGYSGPATPEYEAAFEQAF